MVSNFEYPYLCAMAWSDYVTAVGSLCERIVFRKYKKLVFQRLPPKKTRADNEDDSGILLGKQRDSQRDCDINWPLLLHSFLFFLVRESANLCEYARSWRLDWKGAWLLIWSCGGLQLPVPNLPLIPVVAGKWIRSTVVVPFLPNPKLGSLQLLC